MKSLTKVVAGTALGISGLVGADSANAGTFISNSHNTEYISVEELRKINIEPYRVVPQVSKENIPSYCERSIVYCAGP